MWLSDNPLRSGHRPPHLQNALSSQACGPPLPIWSRAEGIIKNIYLAHTEIPMLWVYLHLPLSDTAIIYFDGMADAGDTTTRNGAPHLDYDVIIIGAGMSGVYQLYRIRELGMRVKVLEAGTGVGGTWYWNRYPGARFDSESYVGCRTQALCDNGA